VDSRQSPSLTKLVCIFVSTHADRQGVDISFSFLFVCTVMNFSDEDKASGVKFCTVWFRGVLGKESPILGNFAATDVQNRTTRRSAGHALGNVWITVCPLH